jgi:hypothetical protein
MTTSAGLSTEPPSPRQFSGAATMVAIDEQAEVRLKMVTELEAAEIADGQRGFVRFNVDESDPHSQKRVAARAYFLLASSVSL